MTIEITAAAAMSHAPSAANAAGGQVQVGYGVSLTDISGFERSMAGAQMRLETRPVNASTEAAKVLMKPFDHINSESARLSDDAKAAQAKGAEMTPGDMMMLTMRCQEFMFHCQLTSNIANRTSDGLQQLFKQQS
jgi:hypothetical protein